MLYKLSLMKQEPKRILFINSEITPYLPENKMSKIGRYLPQGIQEKGKEIRSFMPRFGCINERRNQLHEVIRLSGMNIVINDIDRPLIIKVSSIPAARMQVYFIDNEDYFHRKYIYADADGRFFEDNDERAIFFARGVLETVKKLRWQPDIVHCQGWISYLVPAMLKLSYKDDPIFEKTSIVTSVDSDIKGINFHEDFRSKIEMPGMDDSSLCDIKDGNDLTSLAVKYSDGIIIADQNPMQETMDMIRQSGLPVLDFIDTEDGTNSYIDAYNGFYDNFLDTK